MSVSAKCLSFKQKTNSLFPIFSEKKYLGLVQNHVQVCLSVRPFFNSRCLVLVLPDFVLQKPYRLFLIFGKIWFSMDQNQILKAQNLFS